MMHDYSLRSGGTRTSKQDGGGGSNFTSASSGSGLPGTTIYDISHTETEKHPLGFYQREITDVEHSRRTC